MKWLALLICFSCLEAEVAQIQIFWNSGICKEGCIHLLEKQLDRYEPITNYEINQEGGMATLQWDARVSFDWRKLNTTWRKIGLSVYPVNMVVRGTLSKKGKYYYLDSIGDNVSFRLLGPKQELKNRYVARGSIENYPLEGNLLTKIEEGSKEHLAAVVSGEFFLFNFTEYNLIVHSIKFPGKI